MKIRNENINKKGVQVLPRQFKMKIRWLGTCSLAFDLPKTEWGSFPVPVVPGKLGGGYLSLACQYLVCAMGKRTSLQGV